MPLKPDGRIAPSQDEFDAWAANPVTRFIAEAYRIAANRQRAEWERQFDARLIPADISSLRLELKTREDAYRSILENTLADYIAIVESARPGSKILPAEPRQVRRAAR